LFENGSGGDPGLPYPRFEASFDAWPVPDTTARAWYFDANGALADDAPAVEGNDAYTYDPALSQVTTLPGTDNDSTWLPNPPWTWRPPAPDSAVAYESGPLTDDTVMVGTGSVDLWVQAAADDVDLQVTLSEVRPDGTEVFVQSGWLRASQRQLGEDATELRPLRTDLESDVAPLPAGEWAEARVELFPFGHAFRAGSKVRVIVDTPGGTRPRWRFDVLDEPAGTEIQIARGGGHASRVVLPVIDGIDVPDGSPSCPWGLRAQPCRRYAPL
jgi:putative CocE/NonD family hydrolase